MDNDIINQTLSLTEDLNKIKNWSNTWAVDLMQMKPLILQRILIFLRLNWI